MLRLGEKGNRLHDLQFQKRTRLKFKIGGRTVFARQVRQKPRKAQPFIRRAAERMDREGYDWLMPGLMKETTEKLAKKFAVNVKRTIEI